MGTGPAARRWAARAAASPPWSSRSLSGLVTLGYHLFEYPLYSTDEGIYMERAWAVIRLGRLSPVTPTSTTTPPAAGC